ncbi:unnamed protein product [Allacma fusca]|uniref:Uncharacterized protein n=1 Tax=Allacma fusca TaxID=39272 RepID=A0A8J2PMT5_9HEXA|nr:unnamed protein product [Allacma fusca]
MGAVVDTYEKTVWMLIISSVLLFIPALYMAMKCSGKYQFKTFALALTIPFCVMLEQSYKVRSSGIKMLLSLLFLQSMILGTGYKSNLICYLTFPAPEPVPDTFQELADQTEYQIQLASFKDAGYYFLQGTTTAKFVKIRERYQITMDRFECLKEAATQKKCICIMWDLVSVPIVSMNMTLNRTDLKDADVAVGIKWLNSRKDTELYQKLHASSKPKSKAQPFRIENVAISMFIVVVGLVGSGILFGLERASTLTVYNTLSNKTTWKTISPKWKSPDYSADIHLVKTS